MYRKNIEKMDDTLFRLRFKPRKEYICKISKIENYILLRVKVIVVDLIYS